MAPINPVATTAITAFERITLRLFHASPPAPQMLKVSSQLLSIVIFDSKRRQQRRHHFRDDRINALLLDSVLLRQRLGNDGLDLVIHDLHRLMILATFSKPRLAK